MDRKKEIEKLLFDLKGLGWGRKEIEKEFEYNANYISQALSRGGNDVLLANLKRLLVSVQERANRPSSPGDSFNKERALLKMLYHRVAKQESIRLGITVEQAMDEMDRDTMIAWRDLEQQG